MSGTAMAIASRSAVTPRRTPAENFLQAILREHRLNETWAMNLLQDAGIVSDNCVGPGDVAIEDCGRAIRFLMSRPLLWTSPAAARKL